MDVLHYPEAAHVRKHGPRGYVSYESYKPWLRDEFSFRCVYCLCRERWFPDGEAAFAMDHLVPQVLAPDKKANYENLIYSCCQCNSIRGTTEIADPCQKGFGSHLVALQSGLLETLTEIGTEIIAVCRLNRPTLVAFRHGIFETFNQLAGRNDPALTGLLKTYLGYPVSLPNLALLRPPGGNSKPEGIEKSYYARNSRGELPDLY